MFEAKVYQERRKLLKKQLKSGIVLLPANDECPMNYAANTYRYRQDSTFLYFFGLNIPGLAGIVDIDAGKDILFGDDIGIDDIIWMGHLPKMKDRARSVGVARIAPLKDLEVYLKKALSGKRTIHFLPPYRPGIAARIESLLGLKPGQSRERASVDLIRAVVEQRSVKSPAEVAEIEKALAVTARMYDAAFRMTKPGRMESEIAGTMEGIALAADCAPAFPLIVTINGHILHNHYHGNKLKTGRLLVADSGAETAGGYSSDITRSIPVGGRFNPRQKDVYSIVLAGQLAAIKAMKPGVSFKDVHLLAARTIASGLKDLGLMKGDIDEAVAQGAHALFFPHGLGHMLGLDVHDMENLGENHVGYNGTVERSRQFGLAYLRLARELRPGHVVTVEPGIYFIPDLVALWKKGKKAAAFIDYARVEKFLDFGGTRVEDDVLVTETGRRVLGKPIPKTIKDIEKASA
ncbi:MAG: aminopeptidase P family protein [Acidobacteriota bacterium]|nr:aminopeptidase P family protein [Acidobacteriota bacterium]